MAPTVTRLQFQRTNRDRVNVHLDGEYAFSLPALEAARLRKGQVLTASEITVLLDRDAFARAYDRAVRFLGFRPRSEREIRVYLKRKGEPEPRIEAILEKLRSAGWVDDAAFARFWVENREAFRPKGRRALMYELRQKGVEPEVAEEALLGVDTGSLALETARHHSQRWQHLDFKTFRQRMLGHLMRRGFDYAEAVEAVEKSWESLHPSGSEEEAGA